MQRAARVGAILALVTILPTGCQSKPEGSSPTSQPASQASSLPKDHSTSTEPMPLGELFAAPKELPAIVAKVDGREVSQAAFIHELRQMQVQFSATGIPDDLTRKDVLQGALNRAVDHELRVLLAEDLKVVVDKAAVEAWKADLQHRIERDKAFEAFLLRAGKNEAQRDIDARRIVMTQAIANKVRVEVEEELTTEAKSYYDRHPQDYIERAGTEVWNIFVKAPRGMVQRDRDLARVRAEGLHEKAKNAPEQFESLAISNSDGGKATQGGYLGFVPEGAFNDDLYGEVRKARPGSILPIKEDAVGFTIYKVGKTRDERVIPFEEVQGKIIERIYGSMVKKEVDERIASLRSSKPIEIFVNDLARPKPL